MRCTQTKVRCSDASASDGTLAGWLRSALTVGEVWRPPDAVHRPPVKAEDRYSSGLACPGYLYGTAM